MTIGRRFLVLLLLGNLVTVYSKKHKDVIQKSAVQLFEREVKGIEVDACKNSQASTITKLRLTGKENKLKTCLLKALTSNFENGWAWSELGSLFASQREKSKASTCFKQAAKLSGKVSPFISTWHFIGPFVTGKTEIDGDPLEPWGGVALAAQQRYSKKAGFFSELVPGGKVHWKAYQQKNLQEPLQITPEVNLNDLVSSLGSLAITEWQGWLVGEFAVNSKDENILVQCLGVPTIIIDNVFIAADVYRRDQYWFSAPLSPGIHTMYIRLRAKQTQVVKCSLKSAGANSFEVHSPSMVPDLVEGHVLGNMIALPITNLQSTKWLKNVRISLLSQKHGAPIEVHQLKESGLQTSIAPGQTLPVAVAFQHQMQRQDDGCSGETLFLLEVTSPGSESHQVTVTLRCRKAGESFLFTFIDHDGSIQQAAAIQPLENCPNAVCPILLTLHGTGVGAQNQADGYKRMLDGKWIFGLEQVWVLAPTRHGAHNWEGPGALTAMTALDVLQKLSREAPWIANAADARSVLFAGHSMGGHGAWHLASHFPDRALAVISLAGWIKKEEYGDSNVFFRHDLSSSHTDPAVKAILEACIAENDADKHVSNLKGIPVLARIGAKDRTVHPYYVRRMVRLLKEAHVNVTYSELPGKEHWWWDTWETNDGGALNDPQVRNFTDRAARGTGDALAMPSCDRGETCTMGEEPQASHMLGQRHWRDRAVPTQGEEYTLTVVNPAFGEGLLGVRVLRQRLPFRMSTVKMRFSAERASLTTSNVAALSIAEVDRLQPPWRERQIQVDGQSQSFPGDSNLDLTICRLGSSSWEACQEEHLAAAVKPRGPANYGPARRIAEHPFLIVTGTRDRETSAVLLQLAVYLANLFHLTSDAVARVIGDESLSREAAHTHNLIVLGGPMQNSWTQYFLDMVPLKVTENGLQLGDCTLTGERAGALFLAPNGRDRMALVLLGNSPSGLEDVVHLASPTIPPMARSPFSNLIPDFVLTGPAFGARGPGGYFCTGFWGNSWDHRPELTSCVC